MPAAEKTPTWLQRSITVSIPAAALVGLVTVLLGGGASAAGGIVTRDGDLDALREDVASIVADVRAEQDRRLTDHAAVEGKAIEALEKRLDRIEAKLDRLLEDRR